MNIIHVKVYGVEYKIYEVESNGKTYQAAEPKLYERINKAIEDDGYLHPDAEIEGVPCSIQDVDDLYCYVFGDEENDNPTEQDIIDSLIDVIDD